LHKNIQGPLDIQDSCSPPEPFLSLFPVNIHECEAENKPKWKAMLRV